MPGAPKDGLRPLDLAEQQGHQDCVRILRKLWMLARTPTWTWAETQVLEPEPSGEYGLYGDRDLTCGPVYRVSVTDFHCLLLVLSHVQCLWSAVSAFTSLFSL